MNKIIYTLGLVLLCQTFSFSQATFSWSRLIESGNLEYPYDMVTDGSGNLYIAGRTDGTASTSTAIVKKISADGTSEIWSTNVCTGQALGIALDASGNVFVTGHSTGGLAIPLGSSAFQTSLSGSSDAFVAKLNGSDGSLMDGTYFGGTADENQPAFPGFSGRNHSSEPLKLGMDIDGSGNIFISGFTESADLPGRLNNFESSPSSGYLEWSGFVAKIPSNLSSVTSTYVGGGYNDWVADVEVVGTDVYVVGNSYSHSDNFSFGMTGFDTAHDDFTYKYAGFVIKFNNNLGFLNGTYLGGATNTGATDPEHVFARSLVSDGTNIYVVGDIGGGHPEDFFTAGSYQVGRSVVRNIFFSKLSGDLSTNMYSGYIGGESTSYGTTLIQKDGHIFLGGSTNEGPGTSSNIFPTTTDAFQGTIGGGDDFVLCQFSSDGTTLEFSSFLGGFQDEYVLSIDEGSIKGVGATHSPASAFPMPISADATNDDSWIAFSFSSNVDPFPVELTHFTAKPVGQTVQLDWSTASELNNKGFEIEHSSDGRTFKQIGWVKGNGNTAATSTYEFVDNQPNRGINYYRLKQLDFDDVSEYSKVVSVLFNSKELEINIRPNPATDVLVIEVPENWNDSFSASLTDMTGNRILTTMNETELEISSLPRGVYILRFESKGNIISKKLILK